MLLFAAVALFVTCSDTPRDNPFDPGSEVLLVELLSPPEGRSYTAGHQVAFEVSASTGYDNLNAGDTYLWESDISGVISRQKKFTAKLPAGKHLIKVTVSDSQGRKGSQSFVLTMRSPTEFGIALLVPAVDTALILGARITPQAAEYVPEGFSIIGRLWNFGEGSGIAQSTELEPGAVVFNQVGTFTLSYNVFDAQGRTAADTVSVEVVASSDPPSAQILSPQSDTTINVGDSLWLEAQSTEGSVRVVYRSWLYPEGSGLEEGQNTLETPGWIVFPSPGVLPVRFKVGDILGLVDEDTVMVTVNDTVQPPVGQIVRPAVNDTSIISGDSIYFAGSYSPSGLSNISHQWDFGTSSGLDADALMEPGWKTFASAGNFPVVYLASDLSGRGTPDTVTVNVTANQPPTASITDPSTDSVEIGTGAAVNFAAEDSDPEGRPLTRVWLWDAASGIAVSSADSAAAAGTRVFQAAGTFSVIYRAIDDKGLSAEDTVYVVVTTNSSPLASITAPSRDTTVYAWVPVLFNGTDSDLDGTVEVRKWAFTPGGVSAGNIDTGAPGEVCFQDAGNYRVVYSVIDNKSSEGADTLDVTVRANNKPQATIISLAGAVSITAGDSVSLLAIDSDSDGTVVERVWTYGEGSGLEPDSIAMPDYRIFPNAGSFLVVYRVKDNVGALDADTLYFTVSP